MKGEISDKMMRLRDTGSRRRNPATLCGAEPARIGYRANVLFQVIKQELRGVELRMPSIFEEQTELK